MLKKLTALLLAVLMLFSLFSCKKDGDGDAETGDEDTASESQEINALPVIETENFSVSVSMLTYFFNSYYRSFVSQNESNLEAMGLDPTTELTKQIYSGDYTWFDYFSFTIADSVTRQVLLAEAAKEDGYELTDGDREYIDGEIEKINTAAANSGNSGYYVIRDNYGECVNELTVRKCLELTRYSKYYSDKLASSYNFTDEEINTYFEQNKNSFLSFNYIRYQISDCDTEAVSADFAACTTEDTFVAKIKEYASEALYDADEDYMAELMDSCYVYGAAYNESSSFAKWAFEDGRKAYDSYISTTEEGTVLVAMALPASYEGYNGSQVLYKDLTPLHNITSIEFSVEKYGTAKDAKVKAQEVYDTIVGGTDFDSTLKAFEGGTSSNLIRGNIPDEIEDWVFDDARYEGEIGLVTVANSSSYIIRMEADGIAVWNYYVSDSMNTAAYAADIEALEQKYTPSYNNDGFKEITTVTID